MTQTYDRSVHEKCALSANARWGADIYRRGGMLDRRVIEYRPAIWRIDLAGHVSSDLIPLCLFCLRPSRISRPSRGRFRSPSREPRSNEAAFLLQVT